MFADHYTAYLAAEAAASVAHAWKPAAVAAALMKLKSMAAPRRYSMTHQILTLLHPHEEFEEQPQLAAQKR